MKTLIHLLLISFCLVYPMNLTARSSTISLTQYPIRVSASDPILSHKTALLCDDYLAFLKDLFYIKSFPYPLTSMNIYLQSSSAPSSSAQLRHLNKIQINPAHSGWEKSLTEYITAYFFKNILFDPAFSKKFFPLPSFLIAGFTTKYWIQELDHTFMETYTALQNNIHIPFNIILTTTKKFDSPLSSFFNVQSMMIIDRLLATSTPLDHISQFVKTLDTTPKNSVLTLIQTLGFQSIETVHATFLNHLSTQPVIINALTIQKDISSKTIEEFLKVILTFSFKAPNEKQDTSIFTLDNPLPSRIIVKADDLQIHDLPYISTSQIDGKIITLRMLQDACADPWYTRLTQYIKAFTFLKQGDFEHYYDHLYRATK